MAKGYSKDLRVRAVELVESGESAREAARILNLGASTTIRWMDRWRKTGNVEAKPGTGHSRFASAKRDQEKVRTHTGFRYQANSWTRPRKVVARLECSLQPTLEEPPQTACVRRSISATWSPLSRARRSTSMRTSTASGARWRTLSSCTRRRWHLTACHVTARRPIRCGSSSTLRPNTISLEHAWSAWSAECHNSHPHREA